MKRVAIGLLIAALGTPLSVHAAELVTAEKCDGACADAFGRRPMAICEIAMTKTMLGEVTVRREWTYANFRREANVWVFDMRTAAERSTLSLADNEFNETSGQMHFTYRATNVTGRCRRFAGQPLPKVVVERHPIATTPGMAETAPGLPGRWGVKEHIPTYLGGNWRG